MKTEAIIKMEQIGSTCGDETAPYKVTEFSAKNVKEFIEDVITLEPKEWGDIEVRKDGHTIAHFAYRYGHSEALKTSHPAFSMEIEKIDASGGWSNMDYRIFVKG